MAKIRSKNLIIWGLIIANIVLFVFISYFSMREMSAYNHFYSTHNLSAIKYNHSYVTLYYISFLLAIIIKYSKIKTNNIRKTIYRILVSIGLAFALVSLYKYYVIASFIKTFGYSSVSISFVSVMYYFLSNTSNEGIEN